VGCASQENQPTNQSPPPPLHVSQPPRTLACTHPQDGATYFFIPKAQFSSLSLAGGAAFVVPGPLPQPITAPIIAPNFALAVDNRTFYQILREYGSIDTAEPLLIVIIGNITLAPHPELPPGGFDVTRPVTLMGRVGSNTGIDFGGRVSGWLGVRVLWLGSAFGAGSRLAGRAHAAWQCSRPTLPHHTTRSTNPQQLNIIRLSGAGNLTFDSLALDNLFPGNEESVAGVKGLSTTLAYAIYGVRWRRDDVRLVVVRCVPAVPEQTQIEVGIAVLGVERGVENGF